MALRMMLEDSEELDRRSRLWCGVRSNREPRLELKWSVHMGLSLKAYSASACCRDDLGYHARPILQAHALCKQRLTASVIPSSGLVITSSANVNVRDRP
jgi:hypothetical protein